MKSILLSIRPEWVEKILNKEKTIEVRKKFPKDYVGWVYIYCTKGKPNLWKRDLGFCAEEIPYDIDDICCNGKIVARFWCDKVEETFYQEAQSDNTLENILKKSCLSDDDLWAYADNNTFYAVHISKLEIFDRPKELDEFGIERAPQNYCYIEGE